MNTSESSPTAKAIRLAAEMRAEKVKIASYDFSKGINLAVAGSETANSENRKRKKIITKPDLTTLCALSLPKTSVMTSLIA